METQAAPAYYCWGAEETAQGPVELPALVNWIRQGRVTSGTWVYRNDTRAWRPASEWPELKPLLGPRPATAGAAAGLSPEQLRRIKIFAELANDQLHLLLGYLEPVEVRQFSTLFRKGDPGDAMYSVLEGEVRAREIADGKETTLFTLGVGDSFGELALLIEGERASDIVANTDSKLLRLPARAFERIIHEAPGLAAPLLRAMARTLAHRARALGDRLMSDLMLVSAAGRVRT